MRILKIDFKLLIIWVSILLLTGCTLTKRTPLGDFSLTLSIADIEGLYDLAHSRNLDKTYFTESGLMIVIKK